MRFKLVPAAPDSLAAVREAQGAVPLVPGSEDDCCARLQRRCGYPSRDVSRTWLTFLRALELAEETPSGFRRLRVDPTPERLRAAFLDRVFLAADALAALVAADEPLDADALFAAVRGEIPTWEHHKNPDTWQTVWRDRLGTHLDWFALLDLAERVDGGFLATERAKTYSDED